MVIQVGAFHQKVCLHVLKEDRLDAAGVVDQNVKRFLFQSGAKLPHLCHIRQVAYDVVAGKWAAVNGGDVVTVFEPFVHFFSDALCGTGNEHFFHSVHPLKFQLQRHFVFICQKLQKDRLFFLGGTAQ